MYINMYIFMFVNVVMCSWYLHVIFICIHLCDMYAYVYVHYMEYACVYVYRWYTYVYVICVCLCVFVWDICMRMCKPYIDTSIPKPTWLNISSFSEVTYDVETTIPHINKLHFNLNTNKSNTLFAISHEFDNGINGYPLVIKFLTEVSHNSQLEKIWATFGKITIYERDTSCWKLQC